MSSFVDELTPVILTGDEEPNIGRTLEQLRWAHRVVVCDSMSRDRTVEIARGFSNVEVYERPMDDLASQWRFALEQVRSDWALTLDADYFVPPAFVSEIAGLQPEEQIAAYEAGFIYAIGGRPLRGSLYPARPVLLRRGRYDIFMDGHTQRVAVHGTTVPLHERLIHDDRKNFSRFISRQRRYMKEEAAKLLRADPRTLNRTARLRRLRVIAPLVVVPYTLLRKGLIRDGLAGLHYAFERFLAEAILSIELFRARTKY
jgi:glycosyltransferase involved in cell wall biosynthesis